MNNSTKKNDKRVKVLSEEQKSYIVYSYTQLKKGLNSIGREIGVSGAKVKKTLQELGVHVNTFQEAMGLQRHYNVNDNYFKIQSHNMAYILGFLSADGGVSKDTNHITIDLKDIDEEILYKIKKELSAEAPLEHYVNNSGCHYSRLRICSKTIKDDLSHYGITPKKTFTLEPPKFLDEQYYLSYIRGYFDGDGCFYCDKNFQNQIWYICGARKNVLDWIEKILVNQLGILSTGVKVAKTLKNGDPFYQLSFYRGDSIKRIFENLYIDNTICLERKYQKMKNFYEIKSKSPYSFGEEEKRYAELTQNEV